MAASDICVIQLQEMGSLRVVLRQPPAEVEVGGGTFGTRDEAIDLSSPFSRGNRCRPLQVPPMFEQMNFVPHPTPQSEPSVHCGCTSIPFPFILFRIVSGKIFRRKEVLEWLLEHV